MNSIMFLLRQQQVAPATQRPLVAGAASYLEGGDVIQVVVHHVTEGCVTTTLAVLRCGNVVIRRLTPSGDRVRTLWGPASLIPGVICAHALPRASCHNGPDHPTVSQHTPFLFSESNGGGGTTRGPCNHPHRSRFESVGSSDSTMCAYCPTTQVLIVLDIKSGVTHDFQLVNSQMTRKKPTEDDHDDGGRISITMCDSDDSCVTYIVLSSAVCVEVWVLRKRFDAVRHSAGDDRVWVSSPSVRAPYCLNAAGVLQHGVFQTLHQYSPITVGRGGDPRVTCVKFVRILKNASGAMGPHSTVVDALLVSRCDGSLVAYVPQADTSLTPYCLRPPTSDAVSVSPIQCIGRDDCGATTTTTSGGSGSGGGAAGFLTGHADGTVEEWTVEILEDGNILHLQTEKWWPAHRDAHLLGSMVSIACCQSSNLYITYASGEVWCYAGGDVITDPTLVSSNAISSTPFSGTHKGLMICERTQVIVGVGQAHHAADANMVASNSNVMTMYL
jgi:hypothetical protein